MKSNKLTDTLLKPTIKQVKKELGLTNADIAEIFGYKNMNSYYASARRNYIENGIVVLYERIKGAKKAKGTAHD